MTTAGAYPKEASAVFRARVHMREARDGDLPALPSMITAAYRIRDGWLFGNDRPRVVEQDLVDELSDARTTGIVAEVDGSVAGFVLLRRRGDYASFGLLAVALAQQGRGLAQMIIQRAEDLARASGCRELRLECIRENGLPPFYEALGFAA